MVQRTVVENLLGSASLSWTTFHGPPLNRAETDAESRDILAPGQPSAGTATQFMTLLSSQTKLGVCEATPSFSLPKADRWQTGVVQKQRKNA